MRYGIALWNQSPQRDKFSREDAKARRNMEELAEIVVDAVFQNNFRLRVH
jgi:hypothetical protein